MRAISPENSLALQPPPTDDFIISPAELSPSSSTSSSPYNSIDQSAHLYKTDGKLTGNITADLSTIFNLDAPTITRTRTQNKTYSYDNGKTTSLKNSDPREDHVESIHVIDSGASHVFVQEMNPYVVSKTKRPLPWTMTIAQGSGHTTAKEQAFLLFVSGDSRSPDTGFVFLLPCILVANFRRDLTLLGTRILRKQGLLLIDPPSPNRPHIVRVENDSSALFQDYLDYPPRTPGLECLRSSGGLLGLLTHKQEVFNKLLSINDGTPFDAAEALNFYFDFTGASRTCNVYRNMNEGFTLTPLTTP